MLFALFGCSSTPFIYPPTALHTVDLSPPDEGEGTIGIGGTAFVGGTILPDFLGGWVDGGLAVGLPHDLDVSVRAAAMLVEGPAANVAVGWTPLRYDAWEGGLALGLGASNHHWAGSQEEVQEDGTTIVTDSWDYTYWSLAPSITVRQAWKPTRWFRLPAAVRYSRAFASGFIGDHPSGDYHIDFLDACVGPEFIAGPVRFGLDLGILTGVNPDGGVFEPFPYPRVGLSMELVLPLWGDPVTRLAKNP